MLLGFGFAALPAAEKKAAEVQVAVKPELNPDWNIKINGKKTCRR